MHLHDCVKKLRRQGLTILATRKGANYQSVIEVKALQQHQKIEPAITESYQGEKRTVRPAKMAGHLILFIEGEQHAN
mgnify:CR=1 FL=1